MNPNNLVAYLIDHETIYIGRNTYEIFCHMGVLGSHTSMNFLLTQYPNGYLQLSELVESLPNLKMVMSTTSGIT